ncbi:MAG: M48 family metalloprotease [Pseudomonadota bacterium]|nr:M48 family metalloprotease [Pseudomonadota bacterium]
MTLLCSTGAGAISVIRDTETETWLLGAVGQIFGAAGLDPDNAEIVIVNDPSINAFVAGGQTIFIHTGLILKAQTPDELMFVLSHETGHIVGGHITRGYQELKNAQTTALISTVIGGVLAVAGGRPDAGIAVMAGGQMSSMGLFTKYRQTEESSADRIAVDIMHKLGYSMKGFEGVMKAIKSEERLNSQSDYSYLRTHPMTQTRIADLERFLKNAKPVHHDLAFDLMRAKLHGFLEPPDKTLKVYYGETEPDLYAQSIAYYRQNNFKRAFQILDGLILKDPKNPYFYELKGQLFFEIGKLKEAAENYRQASVLKSDSGLIKLSYAQVLLELGGKQNAITAENLLHFVVQNDMDAAFGWQLLAKAYHLQKKTLYADYAMVEYFRSLGNIRQAQKRAEKIKDSFPQKSAISQRLKDILEVHKSL